MIGKGYGQREVFLPMRLKPSVTGPGFVNRTARPEAAPTPANGQIQALQAASESMVGDRLTPA